MKMFDASNEVVSTKFEFKKFDIIRDSNGKKIARFYLKKPIPEVIGTQYIQDGEGKRELIRAYGVDVITFHESEWTPPTAEKDEDGITQNPDGSGSVENQLVIDVTLSGDVQMRRDTLAGFGNRRRRENRDDRSASAWTQMQEKRAQYELQRQAEAEAEAKKAEETKKLTESVASEAEDEDAEGEEEVKPAKKGAAAPAGAKMKPGK